MSQVRGDGQHKGTMLGINIYTTENDIQSQDENEREDSKSEQV
jgi:hypothetical protein